MLKVGGLKRHIGGNSKIGSVLDLPMRYLDGASFMSRDVYGHLFTNYGTAWNLDGRNFSLTTDYIETLHNTIFNVPDGGNLMFEGAIKTTSAVFGILLQKIAGGTPANPGWYVRLNNILGFECADGSQYHGSQAATPSVNDDLPHHLAIYKDGDTDILLWVDGRDKVGADYGDALDTVDNCSNNNTLRLGYRLDVGNAMVGKVKHSALWNYRRYAAQILQDAIEARRN